MNEANRPKDIADVNINDFYRVVTHWEHASAAVGLVLGAGVLHLYNGYENHQHLVANEPAIYEDIGELKLLDKQYEAKFQDSPNVVTRVVGTEFSRQPNTPETRQLNAEIKALEHNPSTSVIGAVGSFAVPVLILAGASALLRRRFGHHIRPTTGKRKLSSLPTSPAPQELPV